MSRIFIIGSGVVGTATGRGFIKAGHDVTFVDVLPSRIKELTKEGFDARAHIELPDEASFLFLTLPTPHDGRHYDLSAFDNGVATVGRALAASPVAHTVVVRSTVPPGTTEGRVLPALERESGLKCGRRLHVGVQSRVPARRIGSGGLPLSLDDGHRVAQQAHSGTAARPARAVRRRSCASSTTRQPPSSSSARTTSTTRRRSASGMRCGWSPRSSASTTTRWHRTVANSAEGSYNREYGIHGGAPYGGVCLPKDTNGFLGFAEELGVEMPLLDAVVTVNETLTAMTDHEIETLLHSRTGRCSERPTRRSVLINDFLWILLLAYFRPLFEMGLLLFGEWWFHTEFKEDRSRFERYVIQVTSVGKEIERVNEIVNEIRTYPMCDAVRDLGRHRARILHRLSEGRPGDRRPEGVRRGEPVQVPCA